MKKKNDMDISNCYFMFRNATLMQQLEDTPVVANLQQQVRNLETQLQTLGAEKDEIIQNLEDTITALEKDQ